MWYKAVMHYVMNVRIKSDKTFKDEINVLCLLNYVPSIFKVFCLINLRPLCICVFMYVCVQFTLLPTMVLFLTSLLNPGVV